ncbi:MAG: YeeE/YedE thiosulfate transporter family protein [Anaerolineales bacterium]
MTTASKPVRKGFDLKALFNRPAKNYVHPYFGGLVLGIVLFLSLFLTGNGLGASGAISRLDTALIDLVAPQHVDTTPYLLKLAGGDKNPLDDWTVIIFFGAMLGGFTSGLINGRVRFEINKGPQISNRTRLIMAFIGGTIFVYGARMARGCTSGQALTGGATLAAGSWVIMFAIFGGAYLLAYFVRKLWI